MFHNKLTPVNVIKFENDEFDTKTIVAAMNRYWHEITPNATETELLDLMVLGQLETQPSRLRVIGKVRYTATNRVVAVPYEVDAGALRGIEDGMAAG